MWWAEVRWLLVLCPPPRLPILRSRCSIKLLQSAYLKVRFGIPAHCGRPPPPLLVTNPTKITSLQAQQQPHHNTYPCVVIFCPLLLLDTLRRPSGGPASIIRYGHPVCSPSAFIPAVESAPVSIACTPFHSDKDSMLTVSPEYQLPHPALSSGQGPSSEMVYHPFSQRQGQDR